MDPMVSICAVTYNHAPYIEAALESFLAQKTDFPIEILIHDDASTDGTTDIVKRYAARYPDIVKPVYEEVNQYSKGVPMDITFNFPRARGKYIALCECDDYWTDTGKLQAQTDYMEAHPDCTFCFTNGVIVDASGKNPPRHFIPYYESERAFYTAANRCYTVGELCGLSFVPTAGYFFPRSVLERMPECFYQKVCEHGDLKMRLFFTAAGYACYLHRFSCAYRQNVPGSAFQVWSRDSAEKTARRAKTVIEMLDDVNDFTDARFKADLRPLRDRYTYVWLWNEPTHGALRDADAYRVYRALPFQRRAAYCLKRFMPRPLIDMVKKSVLYLKTTVFHLS